MQHPEIIFFFLVISFIYSSVGFGGGSSYLAVLALYAFPMPEMKLIALVCNIIVVTGSTLLFIKHKQLNWRRVIPLVLVSVPLAFLGARLKLSEDVFFIILGCSLIAAAVLLWIRTGSRTEPSSEIKSNIAREAALGGTIGFLSGMVGIGGGIFLSPVLNLMKWDNAGEIAATAAFFILVNSMAGIAGQLSVLPQDVNYLSLILLASAVLIGGQLGARLGINKFNPLIIRRITALVVLFAGVEVLYKHLHLFH